MAAYHYSGRLSGIKCSQLYILDECENNVRTGGKGTNQQHLMRFCFSLRCLKLQKHTLDGEHVNSIKLSEVPAVVFVPLQRVHLTPIWNILNYHWINPHLSAAFVFSAILKILSVAIPHKTIYLANWGTKRQKNRVQSPSLTIWSDYLFNHLVDLHKINLQL